MWVIPREPRHVKSREFACNLSGAWARLLRYASPILQAKPPIELLRRGAFDANYE